MVTNTQLKRFLIIELTNGTSLYVNQKSMEGIYREFNLPFPNINKPILSKEFRKAVNDYGITVVSVDDDDLGIHAYLPPSRIHNMKFYIAEHDMDWSAISKREQDGHYATI